MKYSTVVLALAAGVFAVPQAAPAVTSAPAATPAAVGLTPQLSCALGCPAGNVNCQAACLGIARPNASQAVATNDCVAKCDQGNGSPEATQAYSKCVQSCIGSLFPSSQTAFGAGQASSVPIQTTGTTGASVTNTGPNGAQKTGSAEANSVRLVGAGLAGLLAVFVM